MQITITTISGAWASNATNEIFARRAFETTNATRKITISAATAICR